MADQDDELLEERGEHLRVVGRLDVAATAADVLVEDDAAEPLGVVDFGAGPEPDGRATGVMDRPHAGEHALAVLQRGREPSRSG